MSLQSCGELHRNLRGLTGRAGRSWIEMQKGAHEKGHGNRGSKREKSYARGSRRRLNYRDGKTLGGEETRDVKAGEGETEINISSDAKKEEGLPICWVITDSEQERTGPQLKAGTQDLRRAFVEGDR